MKSLKLTWKIQSKSIGKNQLLVHYSLVIYFQMKILCIPILSIVPDDVYAIDENTFYVTNVYHYRKDQSAILHTLEILAKRPWTNILLCKKTNQWQCSIVSRQLAKNRLLMIDLN